MRKEGAYRSAEMRPGKPRADTFPIGAIWEGEEVLSYLLR